MTVAKSRHNIIDVKISNKTPKERVRWYLEAVADTDREWMVSIEPVPFIIGRATDCNLKLTDKWISRYHSEIRISSDHLWIRDLDSKNGTFVNHERIGQAELLKSGDSISIGKFQFKVKSLAPDTTTSVEDTCFLSEVSAYPPHLEPKLRALIRERKVIPHFQPVLQIPSQTVMGFEILGRVIDKTLPANPAELFAMADWFGCSADLSALFREAGVDTGSQLPGDPILFVNVTPNEISQMDVLLESLKKVHENAPANKIVIEMNEKATNETSEMTRLRDTLALYNMGLAFDDFGVGQTRLVELAKVPPDFLKFDISLIHKIHLAPKGLHQMVSTFVKAAGDLGVATIAEGVECHEEAETCHQLGFGFAQGFFYGRPLPITEIPLDS